MDNNFHERNIKQNVHNEGKLLIGNSSYLAVKDFIEIITTRTNLLIQIFCFVQTIIIL